MKRTTLRFFSFILVALISLGSVAFAADGAADMDNTKRIVSIKAQCLTKMSQKVAVYIIKPDKNIEDYNILNPMETIHYIETVVTEADGSFELKVGFKDDDPSGLYGLWLKSSIEDDPSLEDTFYYINGQSKAELYAYIKQQADEGDTVEMGNIILEYTTVKPVFEIETDGYYASNKDAVLLVLCNICKDGVSEIDDFETKFKEAVAVTKVNVASEAELDAVFKENVSHMEITLDDDYDEYKTQVLTAFMQKKTAGGFESGQQVKQLYTQTLAMAAVNNQSDSVKMDAAIKKYSEYYGINLTDYEKYNYYDVVKTLLLETYADKDAFKKAVYGRLTELGDPGSSGDGGNNGNGGGNGGGGGGINFGSNSPANVVIDSDVANASSFADLPSTHWAYEYISVLKSKNIINGVSETCFEPDRMITREEFIKLLTAALELVDNNAEANFVDVTENDWCYVYVASALNKGICKGVGNNLFGKGDYVTRQDMAAMAYNAAVAGGHKFKTAETAKFGDDAQIADYASKAVYAMKAEGIISGMGGNIFSPKGFSTRAQAAKIIYALLGI